MWGTMSSWMTGKTIKANDSDELEANREELMRNYSATEEMTIDYSRNFKSLNHYASDELKRLPASFKEDLLNLPKSDRVSIYFQRKPWRQRVVGTNSWESPSTRRRGTSRKAW